MKNYVMASLVHAGGVLATALILLGGSLVLSPESLAGAAIGIALLGAGFTLWISVVTNVRRYRVPRWYSGVSLAILVFAAYMGAQAYLQ